MGRMGPIGRMGRIGACRCVAAAVAGGVNGRCRTGLFENRECLATEGGSGGESDLLGAANWPACKGRLRLVACSGCKVNARF